MKSVLLSLFVAGLIANHLSLEAKTVTVSAPDPVSSNLKVRISTSTYLADGRVLAATGEWPVATNTAVTAYAATGTTVCEPRPATLVRPPTTSGFGWQVDVTPVVGTAGQHDLRVQWRRLGSETAPEADRTATGTATLKLRAGDRVVVDYSRSSGQEGCSAVGMSLEIGLEAVKNETLVEAEVWLMRVGRDGTERSERQVLRFPMGASPTSFYFDEARLGPSEIRGAAFLAQVSGELTALAAEDGKLHLSAKVVRRHDKLQLPNANTTIASRHLVSGSGEELTFQFPPVEVATFSTKMGSGQTEAAGFETRTLPVLAVRVRVKLLK